MRLSEGVSRIDSFLAHAYLREGISVKELARLLRLPIPVTSAIKNECKKSGVLEVAGSGVRLTPEGGEYVRGVLGYENLDAEKLLKVLDAPALPLALFAKETEAFELILQARPPVDVTVDQSLGTAETGIKRALLMLRSGGLIGKKVLFAGDDDMTSIAACLVIQSLTVKPEKTAGGTPFPAALTVLDIDGRILNFIRQASAPFSVPVETALHDFRQPLPEKFARSFDSVFSDPPYTLPGVSLFVSRGVKALKKESDLRFYLSFSPKDPAARLAIQRMLGESGLIIEGILEGFNRYNGAQIIGGVSDLNVLTTTGETLPLLEGAFAAPIYTGETNPRTRVYECKSCRAKYSVGHGEEIKTVERLKEAGCAQCGGSVFTLKDRRVKDERS